MLRSLRSRLIVASVLWTAGLLAVMHMLTLMVVHILPGVRTSHPVGPVLAGLALMTAGLLGLRQALAPFRQLRERLWAVRKGDRRRVEGAYPNEVQPLVDELNALLEDREKAVKRAIATAGDLAHGLKTPLALLAQEADRAGAAGNPELAESIAEYAERMSRQVNYHLARARAAASGAAGAVPLPRGCLCRRSGTHAFEAVCRPCARDLVKHSPAALRPGATGGSRRNARQPAGQCMQMGKI